MTFAVIALSACFLALVARCVARLTAGLQAHNERLLAAQAAGVGASASFAVPILAPADACSAGAPCH